MATQDKLLYFNVRARGEPTRMMYALAGKPLTDERVTEEEWAKIMTDQPLGQLPVFTCEHGTLPQSNSIARYVAKKLGLAGCDIWEEALNDMVVETSKDSLDEVVKEIYMWKLFKLEPEPVDSAKVIEKVKAKFLKGINYVQSVAEKRGKKFIICDKISLADVWLYSSLEFSKPALPNIMEITPWVKEFVSKFESDEKMKKYLSERPESAVGF